MQRISLEELLERNVRGTIVKRGKVGIAAVQVVSIDHDGDDIRIVTGLTARMDRTTGVWRSIPTTRRPILVEAGVRAYMLPWSVGLFHKNGRTVCIRTDRAPIVSSEHELAIPLPNFDNL